MLMSVLEMRTESDVKQISDERLFWFAKSPRRVGFTAAGQVGYSQLVNWKVIHNFDLQFSHLW